MSEIALAPSWILSCDHAASSYGVPVLTNVGTGEAFGPGDTVEACPSWGMTTARDAVRRMAERKALDAEALALVTRFVEAAP